MQNHTAGEGRWAHGGERREPLITAESAAHRSSSASAAMSSDTLQFLIRLQPSRLPSRPHAARDAGEDRRLSRDSQPAQLRQSRLKTSLNCRSMTQSRDVRYADKWVSGGIDMHLCICAINGILQ